MRREIFFCIQCVIPNHSILFHDMSCIFTVPARTVSPRKWLNLFLRERDRELPVTFPVPPRDFVSRFISSRRINGHYTLILRVDRISLLAEGYRVPEDDVSILTSWNCSLSVWSDVMCIIAILALNWSAKGCSVKVRDIDFEYKCTKSKRGMHKIEEDSFHIIRYTHICMTVSIYPILPVRSGKKEQRTMLEKLIKPVVAQTVGFYETSRSSAEISARSDTRVHLWTRVSKISFRSSRVSKLGQNIQSPGPSIFRTLDARYGNGWDIGEGLVAKFHFGKSAKMFRVGARLSRATSTIRSDRGKWHSKSSYLSEGAAPPIPPYIDPILPAIAVRSVSHRIRHDALKRRAWQPPKELTRKQMQTVRLTPKYFGYAAINH